MTHTPGDFFFLVYRDEIAAQEYRRNFIEFEKALGKLTARSVSQRREVLQGRKVLITITCDDLPSSWPPKRHATDKPIATYHSSTKTLRKHDFALR